MSQASIISSSDLEYLDISSSPPPSLPRFSPESSPPTSTSHSIHKRLRTSWVYKHMPDPNTEYRYFNRGKEEWRCKYCSKAYSTNGGTRVI
jgi:hypothetical protein